MLTLLSECHFWSRSEDVRIKLTDYGAFRYIRNRELQQQQLQQHQHQQQQPQQGHHHHNINDIAGIAKRDYTERRSGTAVLKNSRKTIGRLKDNIKKLEELLKLHKIVYSQWKDATQILLLFANGVIVHICVDVYTGDILRMVYEKFLVGKLAADVITDAFFTRSHIVLTYNTNQLTIVYLQKPNIRTQGPEKIANMEPRCFHVIIPGPAERKLSRHLSVNNSFDLFVVWTKSSQNEVYPWRPTIRDQDRANIHVFKLKGIQLESISYCWSENDPLCVDFLRSSESQLLTVEQKVSRKGEISAEICSYEISAGKMQRSSLTSLAMGTQICCFAFSPDQEKLFIGTIDRKICLHDLVLETTKYITDIDIIPTQCSWHCDSSIVMIANDRAQFQCYDLALTPIGNQLQSEDVTPSNLLDLSHYFILQPTLLNISFSHKPDLVNFPHSHAQTDCFLLFLFENGPIGCLRFFAGAGMRGDIHNSGLTADVIVDKYLALNQLEKAVNLLFALNWETYGAMCLISLHKIANHIFFRGSINRIRLELMTKALKTFTDTLSDETKDEFSDQVFDLKRRFFFFLLGKNLFTEAFEIAQDIEDYDLFMDLYNITKNDENLIDFTSASFSQAAAILHEEDRANGNLSIIGDYNADSICSESTYSEVITSNRKYRNNMLKNYVPPLPSLKSKVINSEMIKINIPKPELRTEMLAENKRAPLPPLPDVRHITVLPSSTTNTNLATLSLKSTTNLKNTTWQNVPDQTIGIPTASQYTPNVSLHTTNGTNNNSYVHYATPAVIAEHTLAQRAINNPILNNYQPKYYQHPLVSGTIPPTTISLVNTNGFTDEQQRRLNARKPAASILANSNTTLQNGNINNAIISSTNGHANHHKETTTTNGRSTNGEKNKVKFSDTVQVAVVPEIPRKEKIMPQRKNGYVRPLPRNLTNPKKELADSLPLCHPNDDYLKDFNPISTDIAVPRTNIKNVTTTKEEQSTVVTQNKANKSTPTIKVVHFGVV